MLLFTLFLNIPPNSYINFSIPSNQRLDLIPYNNQSMFFRITNQCNSLISTSNQTFDSSSIDKFYTYDSVKIQNNENCESQGFVFSIDDKLCNGSVFHIETEQFIILITDILTPHYKYSGTCYFLSHPSINGKLEVSIDGSLSGAEIYTIINNTFEKQDSFQNKKKQYNLVRQPLFVRFNTLGDDTFFGIKLRFNERLPDSVKCNVSGLKVFWNQSSHVAVFGKSESIFMCSDSNATSNAKMLMLTFFLIVISFSIWLYWPSIWGND